MKKVLITISYDGTNYSGWQRQCNAVTIQETIENALEKLTGEKCPITAAGRTDAKVHALGQRACFFMDGRIPAAKIPCAVNSFLPDDIVVTDAVYVSEDFHPRYLAQKKVYCYKILNAPYQNPLLKNFIHYERVSLNFDKMKEAGNFFLGTHDFKSFCASGTSVTNFERTIYWLTLSMQDSIIEMKICGNGFLYNMVRIIAGTLIDVGKGKTAPEDIKHIIEAKDRNAAGKTARPEGLCLLEVLYDS